MDVIAEAACRYGEHAAELAAAEDANGGTGEDRFHGSVSRRTLSVCSLRKARSLVRSSGS